MLRKLVLLRRYDALASLKLQMTDEQTAVADWQQTPAGGDNRTLLGF